MAHSKKQGQKAFALMSQWREQGVPDLITSYEAYRLTNGLVGKPNKSSAMRLVDVALKAVKVGA
jgi:hypothetical protein